jgi:hypothetical protein
VFSGPTLLAGIARVANNFGEMANLKVFQSVSTGIARHCGGRPGEPETLVYHAHHPDGEQ